MTNYYQAYDHKVSRLLDMVLDPDPDPKPNFKRHLDLNYIHFGI